MQKEIGVMPKITYLQCGKSCNTKNLMIGLYPGKQYSVKQFINLVAKKIKLKIFWKGKGLNEKAYSEENEPLVEIKKRYFRPAEVDNLKGNSQKAKKILKWKPSKI